MKHSRLIWRSSPSSSRNSCSSSSPSGRSRRTTAAAPAASSSARAACRISRRALRQSRPRSRWRWSPSVSSRSEEHTSELQSRQYLVCRLLLEKNNIKKKGGLSARSEEEAEVGFARRRKEPAQTPCVGTSEGDPISTVRVRTGIAKDTTIDQRV